MPAYLVQLEATGQALQEVSLEDTILLPEHHFKQLPREGDLAFVELRQFHLHEQLQVGLLAFSK